MTNFPHFYILTFSKTQISKKNMEISCQQDSRIITGYTCRVPNRGC